MTQQTEKQGTHSWTVRRDEKRRRMQRIKPWMKGPILAQDKMVETLRSESTRLNSSH